MKRLGLGDVRKRYGIHRHLITELVRDGFVQPQRGAKREYRFSFQDIVLLRMAQDLIRSGIAPKKTSRFLLRLRDRMPAIKATGMRFSTAGRDIVFRENGRLCTIDGQIILDFGADLQPATPASVIAMQAAGAPHATRLSAEAFYHVALAMEQTKPSQAMQHYRKAIRIDATYVAAYVNLGCLLIDGGNYPEAGIVLEEGIAHCPDNALLHFNLGIVLEETGKPGCALAQYRHAVDLKPMFADAHYNAARICETLGYARAALRHLNAYRRLEASARAASRHRLTLTLRSVISRVTSEPAPAIAQRKGPLLFVVHLHAARRLHYDLRLELDGVLKCWAIPNGLLMKPGEKHLAVPTEDHPLSYAPFDGVIPPKQYGAG